MVTSPIEGFITHDRYQRGKAIVADGGGRRPFTVLISAAGRRVALLDLFRQALRDLGIAGRVLATDITPLAAAWQHADEGFVVPPCDDEDFIPIMVDLCQREGVSLLVPTIDPELVAYADERKRFLDVGTQVAVSAPATVHLAADKVATHAWLLRHGFPTVRQATVENYRVAPEQWPFPLVVKPRWGSSTIGVSFVADRAALEVATRGKDYLIQNVAPGVEYTVDVLVDQAGRLRCCVPRRRLEVRAGEVSKAVTVRHDPLQDLVRNIIEALPGVAGALNVQIFVDNDATMSVIEINPRFGGGFPLTERAGARFPAWLIEEALNLPSTASLDGWAPDVVMLRYDDAVFLKADDAGL